MTSLPLCPAACRASAGTATRHERAPRDFSTRASWNTPPLTVTPETVLVHRAPERHSSTTGLPAAVGSTLPATRTIERRAPRTVLRRRVMRGATTTDSGSEVLAPATARYAVFTTGCAEAVNAPPA